MTNILHSFLFVLRGSSWHDFGLHIESVHFRSPCGVLEADYSLHFGKLLGRVGFSARARSSRSCVVRPGVSWDPEAVHL